MHLCYRICWLCKTSWYLPYWGWISRDLWPPVKKRRKLNNNIKWSCSEKSKHMCVYIYVHTHTHIESYLFYVAVPQHVHGTKVHHVGHMKTMAAGYIWKQNIDDHWHNIYIPHIYMHVNVNYVPCAETVAGRNNTALILPIWIQTGCETGFYFYFIHF